MTQNAIVRVWPLSFQWETADPFLFCVHHVDRYPAGNAQYGPATSLTGRDIGNDFSYKDGFSMYHGDVVPGFPVHPHRGFETVTVVRRGLVDHADSLGAAGRYSSGDVQWMTAGRGVQHSEMFPLLNSDRENTMELFQIWLNLPAAKKMVEPHFTMFWRDTVPKQRVQDGVDVEIIAGSLDGTRPPAPPPDSWAADPEHEVAIWLIALAPGARWSLPTAAAGVRRNLYFHTGQTLRVAEREIAVRHGVELSATAAVTLESGSEPSQLLLLQGKPIGEPVVSYGPFVMNTRTEIEQAFADYRRTEFGGWPWPRRDQIHVPTRGRFARFIGGREEEPGEN